MTGLTEEQQETVIQSIVQQITENENVASDDLPPLYDAIDPTVFKYLPEPSTLKFQYFGYTVVVNGDRTVAVHEHAGDRLCAEA